METGTHVQQITTQRRRKLSTTIYLGNSEDLAFLRQGSCTTQDPDELFVGGAAQQKAKKLCRGCQVIAVCGNYALRNREEFGIWGGKTERERRAELKRRDNTARRRMLAAAADLQEQAS